MDACTKRYAWLTSADKTTCAQTISNNSISNSRSTLALFNMRRVAAARVYVVNDKQHAVCDKHAVSYRTTALQQE